MNDDFLTCFRRAPRPEFAGELFRRISRERRFSISLPLDLPAIRRAALVLAILCLVFTTALGLPGVRAVVKEAIRHLGEVPVWETDRNPYLGSEGKVISPLRTSLAQAQALLAGKVNLPTWVPDGFVLKDQVQLYQRNGQWRVVLIWVNTENHQNISLDAEHLTQDFVPTEIVGIGSVEEVVVNGQPAALVRGAWSSATKIWTPTGLVHLKWKRGQTLYQLVMREGTVPVEDLVRMAESMG